MLNLAWAIGEHVINSAKPAQLDSFWGNIGGEGGVNNRSRLSSPKGQEYLSINYF